MKLLCITHGPAHAPATNGHWEIEFGEIYEGVGTYECPKWGLYYFLSHDPNYAYAAEHFVELPEDDKIVDCLTNEDKMVQALAEFIPEAEMPQDSFDRVWKGIEKAFAQ